MAITAISIRNINEKSNLKFMTVQEENRLIVDIFQCDREFMPITNLFQGESDKGEYDFHSSLRSEAEKKNQFIKEESTLLEDLILNDNE